VVVSGDYRPTLSTALKGTQQSSVLVRVNPVAAWTIDITAVSVRTITEEWTLVSRSWIDDFDIH
jgi:hypothetical protein